MPCLHRIVSSLISLFASQGLANHDGVAKDRQHKKGNEGEQRCERREIRHMYK